MLEYVNALLIILIIVVLVIDTIFLVKARSSLAHLKSQLESRSLVDLAELKTLDPEFKTNYHKYVVGEIMPYVVDSVNKEIKKQNISLELQTLAAGIPKTAS